MPGRTRSTALLDDPELGGVSDLDQDPKPPAGRGRPRKAATSSRTGARPGRKPGTVTIAHRGTDGKIMSEAAMKAKVAGELGMLLSVTMAGLEFRDPDMAACITEPVDVLGRDLDPLTVFVDGVVNMLARNKKWLAYAAKGEGITDILSVAVVGFTVGRRMAQVSAARRAGAEQTGAGLNADQYPAYIGS